MLKKATAQLCTQETSNRVNCIILWNRIVEVKYEFASWMQFRTSTRSSRLPPAWLTYFFAGNTLIDVRANVIYQFFWRLISQKRFLDIFYIPKLQIHTLSHYSKSQIFVQKVRFFTSFSLKFFLTIFLVKSKLSTAKKSKTIFTSFWSKKKSTIFLGNQSWIFGQKNEDFEQCADLLVAVKLDFLIRICGAIKSSFKTTMKLMDLVFHMDDKLGTSCKKYCNLFR